MKKRITILTLVIVALGVLAVAPMVLGGPMGRRGHAGGHSFAEGFMLGRLPHIKEELDLTDAQADQIKAIVAELRTQNEPYREKVRGNLHDIAKTLLANPNDVASAQAKLDAQVAAEKALKSNVLNATAKALNVLTPAQRTKLGDMVEKHASRMQRFAER